MLKKDPDRVKLGPKGVRVAPRSVLYAQPRRVQGFPEPSLALPPQVRPV